MSKQYNRAAKNALVETKGVARTGCKGWAKKVSHRAHRRVGKVACRDY